MAVITLENMEFHAYHGFLEHEMQLGNTFIVTVSMDMDTTQAAQTDNLKYALNYQYVYDAVKEEMLVPSKLIENVGQRIVNSLMRKFPTINYLRVKLSKQNPPLGGKVQQVSIDLEKYRR